MASTDTAGTGTPAAALSEREIAIRRGAIALFFEHGYAAVGIRQIAAAVGLSTSTLYHYGESKLELLEAVMIDSDEILQAHSERALARTEDPRLRFAGLALTLVGAQVESRKTCYVMDNEMRAVSPGSARGARILGQRRRFEALWEEAIAAGVASGQFTAANTDVARVGLIGMYSQTSLWYRPNRALDRAELCREMVDLGLAALGSARLSGEEARELRAAAEFIRFDWEPDDGEAPEPGFPRYAELRAAP
ncbi:MAG: TetR family transcriptional regulator [Actinobacteria bacterium]|nr:TetR family transcriptional regulator [Actinomycetota bacterium]